MEEVQDLGSRRSDAIPAPDATRGHHLDRVDYAAVALAAALVAGTAAMLVLPGITGHIVAPELDLVLDTTATVVTATVAALAWVRYNQYREPVAHAESAAFLVLAIVNGVAVAASVTSDAGSSQGLLRIGQAQAYIFAAGRILAAGLLVSGGISSLRGGRARYPVGMLIAPAIVVILVSAAVEMVGDQLPQLVMAAPGQGATDQVDVSTTPLGAVVEGGGAALTMLAALVWHRLWHREKVLSHAYLTFGLIIASFAQLHAVIYPGVHPLQVSSGDLLWLAFGAILALAIEAEARTTLVELGKANIALENLREVEVDRAALEERTRLSRELHDGLAQDLWLAKLKAGRLAALPNLDAEAMVLCNELTGAIDDGLMEARQAVMALRLGADDSQAPLCQLMHTFVDDFADRFGLRTEFECDHSTPQLSHRVEAEVLRIAQEAFSNVRRHADATLVRVRFETRDGIVALTVNDNGKGFDPAGLVDGGYGVAGMHERAALIRGRLTIDSRPQGGTTVTVQVPVDGAVPLRLGAS